MTLRQVKSGIDLEPTKLPVGSYVDLELRVSSHPDIDPKSIPVEKISFRRIDDVNIEITDGGNLINEGTYPTDTGVISLTALVRYREMLGEYGEKAAINMQTYLRKNGIQH